MAFTLFQYPLPWKGDLTDLNVFLNAHRVIAVHREIVNSNGQSLLVFIVEVNDSGCSSNHGENARAARVDYREILDEEQFAIFSRLRNARKLLADSEGVPVYNIFSNAQLAEMVQARCQTIEDIAKLNGIGRARVEKYAPTMITHLQTAFGMEPGA